MKRVLTVLTLAFGVCVASAADLVIYVVDMAQAYQSYYKTKQVQQQFASAVDVTNNELKAMDEKRVKLIAELQEIEKKSKNTALTEEARKEIETKELKPKLAELQTLVTNMQGLKNQTQQKLMQQQKEVVAEHRKEIVKVIEKVAADKKADFVFEKGAVYFSKPASDITEDVISALNATAPKN